MRLSFLAPLALVLAGCGDDADDSDDTNLDTDESRVPAILALDGDAAEGEQVYLANCSQLCHGPDGRGKASDPTLLGEDLREKVPEMSDEDIVTIILEGEGVMTAFDDYLTNQQIADVAAYVRAEFGQ